VDVFILGKAAEVLPMLVDKSLESQSWGSSATGPVMSETILKCQMRSSYHDGMKPFNRPRVKVYKRITKELP
jgi:hypothetical protein